MHLVVYATHNIQNIAKPEYRKLKRRKKSSPLI